MPTIVQKQNRSRFLPRLLLCLAEIALKSSVYSQLYPNWSSQHRGMGVRDIYNRWEVVKDVFCGISAKELSEIKRMRNEKVSHLESEITSIMETIRRVGCKN